MEISIRKRFRQGEDGWDGYVRFIGLPRLNEVRTRDHINPRLGEIIFLFPPNNDVVSALCSLPAIDGTGEYYYLLAVNLEEEEVPPLPDSAVLVGYDVSDDTNVSSVLNCGPWLGKLLPITERLNGFGLLTLSDAQLAQKLLPEEWGEEEPHANVDIWALYDITGMRSECDLGQNRAGDK